MNDKDRIKLTARDMQSEIYSPDSIGLFFIPALSELVHTVQ